MIALSFSQVKKAYYEQVILEGASFSLNAGETMGLIGKNGAGKTTLLRLIAKQEKPEDGMIFIDGDAKIGYMTQQDIAVDVSLLDFCSEAFNDLIAMEKRLHEMEVKMANFTDHNAEFDAFMSKYDDLARTFDHL